MPDSRFFKDKNNFGLIKYILNMKKMEFISFITMTKPVVTNTWNRYEVFIV